MGIAELSEEHLMIATDVMAYLRDGPVFGQFLLVAQTQIDICGTGGMLLRIAEPILNPYRGR